MTRPGPDWFTHGYAEHYFAKHLLPLAGQEDFHALQIGAYCGDASEWLLRNVVTARDSWLTDVDTFQGSDEPAHRVIDWQAVLDFYDARMEPFRNTNRFVVPSDTFFRVSKTNGFDFIYVDGSHVAEQVLRDAVNADRTVKVGGIIAFDDYKWSDGSEHIPPFIAIDAFLACYGHRYEILERDLQVWVKRVK